MTLLSDHPRHVTLTDDQFDRLVELLTPGYECSKLMLAELQARQPQPDTPPEEKHTPVPDPISWADETSDKTKDATEGSAENQD